MIRRSVTRRRPVLVHLTTTDMSLDWLLGPQLRAFADAGYDVIGMSAPGPHVPSLEAAGIRHVAVPAFTRSTDPAQDIRAAWQLLGLLRAAQPDIVHTHNPKPGVLGRVAGRLTRTPLIVNTQHGLYAQPADAWQRRLPVYGVERLASAFGDIELVQNPEDVDTLVETLHVPARKVRLLGNGIDLTRFDPASVPGPEARARRTAWGADDDDIVCCVVGRLVREKGIVEVLEAAHILSRTMPRVKFVIIGPADPDKSDAIDDAMLDRARADGCVLLGARGDMVECYAASDLFVTASWREGMPRAAMEAAAMGLPIVATDIRGNRHVVADGETGVLVPLRDAAAMSAAISALATDRERRRRYSDAARALAAREFDQRRVIDRTLEAYATFGSGGAGG